MMTAYLDASAYGAIAGGRYSAAETAALSESIASGGLIVFPSLVVVEELLAPFQSNRTAAVGRLRFMDELVGFDKMLKPWDDLLSDALHAYVAGHAAPSPMPPRRDRRVIRSTLRRIASGSSKYDSDVEAILAEMRARKDRFQRSIAEAIEQTRRDLKQRAHTRAERQALTFEAFWAETAPKWAQIFADREGVGDACRERGVDGLLAVRPAGLVVGAHLSQMFAQVFEGHQSEGNDLYDLWHAGQAGVADVFLTEDRELARRLARIPGQGLRVVTTLTDLLSP